VSKGLEVAHGYHMSTTTGAGLSNTSRKCAATVTCSTEALLTRQRLKSLAATCHTITSCDYYCNQQKNTQYSSFYCSTHLLDRGDSGPLFSLPVLLTVGRVPPLIPVFFLLPPSTSSCYTHQTSLHYSLIHQTYNGNYQQQSMCTYHR
jgi:hypothetical protein